MVTKVGAVMKVGEIVIDNGGIEITFEKKGMGRRIDMFLPTSAKIPRIPRVADLRICCLVFSTRLRGLTKF